jgi:hypothetical protein
MKQRICVAVVLALTLVSCDSNGNERPVNTITQQEANSRVEQYINDVVATLSPPPRLEPLGREEAGDCSDPSDRGPSGRVLANRSHWLRDIPRANNPAVLSTLAKWWTDHNFVVLTDERPKSNYMHVENKTDGFRMYVQESAQGDLSLGATSPCVWPNGTPS